MIIKEIYIENFMCYSDKNRIPFDEGINVIIGDNGYGKSKLYDAFYWVLYDQVFVAEKKDFQNTRIVKSKLISDKAKYNVQDGKISTIVSITFYNKEKDSEYILQRRYSILMKNGEVIESSDSEFTIEFKELSYLNGKMIIDEDKKREIVSRILPPQVKDYMWFQGEQVESIIDFNKQDTLTKAINVLSSIARYDEIISIASSVAKTANKEYDSERRKLSRDADTSTQLSQEKTRYEKDISDLEIDQNELKNNLSIAESKCDELLNKQADAKKVSELQERKRGILKLLNQYYEDLKIEQISFHRKLFRNKWVIKGTRDLQREYANRFSEYEKHNLALEAEELSRKKLESVVSANLNTRLPFNVPEPNYLEWMLEKQKCLVCDRDAKENTDEWFKIKELLDRHQLKKPSGIKDSQKKQNFLDDFKKLYQNGLALEKRIDDIDDDINETLTKRAGLLTKIRNSNSDLEAVEVDIQKLLSDTSLSADQAENLLNEYSIQNKLSKDFKDELNRINQKLDHKRTALASVDSKLNELVKGEVQKWLVEKVSVLNDFEAIAKSTRERVFSKLIELLEQETNKHYHMMTSGNRSTRGIVKFRRLQNGNYMPEINDNEGKPLLGSNTSNLILVMLSTIMAIISAKSSARASDLYTFITDAPTSVFGEDYTIGFCKTVSKVYRQSIIMSKEFYRNESLRRELLTNADINIGKVYMITPSTLESERENRNSLSTKIEELH
mgnify:CR=1 FL=1